MKRQILVWTLLASACAAAYAQSPEGVQVYGLVDAGFNRVTGLKGGTNNQIVSGIMDGSRLGVRGNENLGGGWRALFTLESRLELNNGTVSNRPASGTQLPDRLTDPVLLGLPPSSPAVVAGVKQVNAALAAKFGVNVRNGFWDRQAFIGVVTPVGAILAGRQYTPGYEAVVNFDTLKAQSSLQLGQLAAFPSGVDIRVDNALSYRVQQGPITASAMWAYKTVDAGAVQSGRLWGVQGVYKTEAFSVGGGYNTRENEAGQKSLTSTVVGGTLGLGPGTVTAAYASIQDDHPTGLSVIPTGALQDAFVAGLKQDSRLMHIGYTLVTGALTSYVAYSRLDDKTQWNADVESFGVAYSYALSKRTDINAVVARFHNKGLAQAAPGGAGFLGGVTASAGTSSNNLALGVRHRF